MEAIIMERDFFSLAEANAKVGRKVWVKVDNLYDVRKGVPGTVSRAICLDERVNGFGVRVDWKQTPSSILGRMMTVFTKNEYDRYLTEEPESSAKIAYD
jgi:hypothetical protein